jgi:2-dehydro-3-deoxygluconokinase
MGLYFVTPGAGQRAADVLYDRAGSAFAIAPATADWTQLIKGADWLHVSGVTPALDNTCEQAALNATRAARGAGVKVSFDANFRAKLWEARGDDPRPTLNALFTEADLLFADIRDIGLATGQQPKDVVDAAHIAFARYPSLQRLVCKERTTQSSDHHSIGAAMFTRDGATKSARRAVSGIVDRIGTGDAFAAGLLHGLTGGMDDQHVLDFAVAAACLKHYIAGDFNLATVADVDFFLSNSNSDVRR